MELVSYGLNPKTNLEGIHSMFHLQELKRSNNVSYRGYSSSPWKLSIMSVFIVL